MSPIPQNGFTLTEVLISIVVLAIGILGTFGLQLASFRASHDSALHGAAMQIAASIAESLRTSDRRTAGAANPGLYPEVDYRAGSGQEAGIGCYASDCNAASLSEFDIEQWKAWIRKELPNGGLRICRDADPWDDAQRSYRWECASSAPAVVVMLEPRAR
jgi:type IV pilus assembly protein PilV